MLRINYSGQTNDEFNGYDESSVCSQCGGDNITSCFKQDKNTLFDPDQLNDGEFMIERTCLRCTFYWFEWPLNRG